LECTDPSNTHFGCRGLRKLVSVRAAGIQTFEQVSFREGQIDLSRRFLGRLDNDPSSLHINIDRARHIQLDLSQDLAGKAHGSTISPALNFRFHGNLSTLKVDTIVSTIVGPSPRVNMCRYIYG